MAQAEVVKNDVTEEQPAPAQDMSVISSLEQKVASLEKQLAKTVNDLDTQIKTFNRHIKDLHC